ncbi:hypothetical protein [Desulfovibrio sp.]|uniref:hypothetical protein n=1 Tax=Desulfovibrio sp. TaxID=885 RepID=UPI0039E39E17
MKKGTRMKLKPFDKVLVRHAKTEPWTATFYSHREREGHVTLDRRAVWAEGNILPYDDKTGHLLGTTDDFVPPIDEATLFTCGQWVEVRCGADRLFVKVLYLYCDKTWDKPVHFVFEPISSKKLGITAGEGIRPVQNACA